MRDFALAARKEAFLTQHNLESEGELREAGEHFIEVCLPWLKGLRNIGNKMSVEEYRAAGQHENEDQIPHETPYAAAKPFADGDACSLAKGDE